MELELGLKISRTLDDIRSTDLCIAKDRAGLVFVSQETETMFILTAHLKGYKRENIKISINEDGTLISISGEKSVQEMEMKGWIMYKKEPEIRDFEKRFKIPKGVNLDKIKAKYNDEESTLTISMPKLNKGIVGEKVEELLNHGNEEAATTVNNDGDQIEETSKREGESASSEGHEEENRENEEQLSPNNDDENDGDIYQNQPLDNEKGVVKKRYRSKLCSPCFFMGSAFIASLVVMFASMVRSKRRRD